jgi:hypothetical protein
MAIMYFTTWIHPPLKISLLIRNSIFSAQPPRAVSTAHVEFAPQTRPFVALQAHAFARNASCLLLLLTMFQCAANNMCITSGSRLGCCPDAYSCPAILNPTGPGICVSISIPCPMNDYLTGNVVHCTLLPWRVFPTTRYKNDQNYNSLSSTVRRNGGWLLASLSIFETWSIGLNTHQIFEVRISSENWLHLYFSFAIQIHILGIP